MTTAEQIGGFRERRKALHLTQLDLAKRASVSRDLIIRIETGRNTNLRSSTIDRIDAALRELEGEVAHGGAR